MSIGTLQDWIHLAQLIGSHLGKPTLVGVDENGNIIAVIQDPTSGNYVAVDDNGYLSTVIKGIHDGTLKTVAVDTDGGLIAGIRDPSTGNYVTVDESGYLSSVMKGVHDGTLKTIVVDNDGRIVGVLQGIYEGEYKTLKTDEDGRLVAILTDPEDTWGVFKQMGLAELSARINPLLSLDRRGDVLWWKNFDNGFTDVHLDGSGDNYVIRLDTEGAYWGNYALKMTTGGEWDNASFVAKTAMLLSISNHGASFLFSPGENNAYIRFYLAVRYGGFLRNGWVQINTVDWVLSYYHPTNGWTAIADIPAMITNSAYIHYLKMVIDPITNKYVRLMLDSESYDVSEYPLTTESDDKYSVVMLNFSNVGMDTQLATVWLSGIILTHNEP